MVSIFNIISLVANSSSNTNNNDNNNNINDNQGNDNGAQNAESNTNNGMMAVTQVMVVPPGAGRRKRSQHMLNNDSEHSTLFYRNNTVILNSPNTEPIVANISTRIDTSFLDEVGIGVMLCLNNWHYIHINSTSLKHHCLYRNLCEMNYNCAVFGDGAKLVCTLVSHVVARDLAQSDNDEKTFLQAANR